MSTNRIAPARPAFVLASLLLLGGCGSDGPSEPTTPSPTITTTELPDAVEAETYSEAIHAKGGDGEYFWDLIAGELPPGLELAVDDLTQDQAFIMGVPETAGDFEFTVRVEDGLGRSDSAQLSITVTPPPGPVAIETIKLPPALGDAIYRVILRASGGDHENFDWAVVEGSLPAGLELKSDGQFDGIPQGPDTARFTVEVSSGGHTSRKAFTLVVVEEDTARYNITVFPVVAIPPELEDNVREAIRRWEAAITGNLGAVAIPPDTLAGFPEGSCAGFGPMVNGTALDDIIIMVNIDSIDGRGGPDGNVIGRAGPCALRSDDTPPVGLLTLDEVDLKLLTSEETITDLIQHEIGHVLGFGSLWDRFDLLVGAGTSEPRYTGAEAVAEYQAATSATDSIPVEEDGGEGTRDSHWDEEVFGDELMTGFIEQAGIDNVLSRMTIASFADLGYQVDLSAADQSSFLGWKAGDASADDRVELGHDVVGVGPLFTFGPDGTLTLLPNPRDSNP